MSERRSPVRLQRVFVALALLLALAGFVLWRTAPSPELREASGVQPIPLRSHLVAARALQRVAAVTGMLEASREVELFAEAEGKVVEVGAEELDRVQAGQLLLRMDPLLAEIEITQARANLSRARSELRLAAANLERQGSLRGNSVASEAAYDRAVNDEAVAKATVEDARARLARAADALQKKTMAAPFAGELRAFPVRVGEYVHSGERVGELLDVEILRVTVGLTDREIVAIELGARAQLDVEARPGEPFEGVVRRVGGALDQVSRKFPVQVEIDNRAGRLLPGMVANVRLDLGTPSMRVAIPREAVKQEYGVDSVYVVQQARDGAWRASRRRVETRPVPFDPVQVEVVQGLADGERVAVSSLHQLRDGSLVALRGTSAELDPNTVVQRKGDEVPPAAPDRPAAPSTLVAPPIAGEGG